MELIVINQSKLKIMLTPPDMQKYQLSASQLDCTDEKTRRSFRKIFDDARRQIGFDTAGERLFVQLYTSKEGGCEIFVTKLGEPCDENCDPLYLTQPEQALLRRVFSTESSPEDTPDHQPVNTPDTQVSVPARQPGRSCEPKLRPAPTRLSAILFRQLSDLLTACLRLCAIGYDEASRAYILDCEGDSRYCLLLLIPDTAFFHLPGKYGFLTEYGRETDAATVSCYLAEHGSVLCDANAVQTLGQLV